MRANFSRLTGFGAKKLRLRSCDQFLGGQTRGQETEFPGMQRDGADPDFTGDHADDLHPAGRQPESPGVPNAELFHGKERMFGEQSRVNVRPAGFRTADQRGFKGNWMRKEQRVLVGASLPSKIRR